MERERFYVPESDIDDYTSQGPWEINSETYTFIQDTPSHGDGEEHNIVVKRESDGKYFEFGWVYDRGNYYYDDLWLEVQKKVINKTVYEWDCDE